MIKLNKDSSCLRSIMPVLALMVILMLAASDANAATTGGVFQAAYNTLVGWVEGFGGKVFAVLAFFVGLGVAAWTKSLLPPLLGIGIAFLVAFGIPIIEGVATATI